MALITFSFTDATGQVFCNSFKFNPESNEISEKFSEWMSKDSGELYDVSLVLQFESEEEFNAVDMVGLAKTFDSHKNLFDVKISVGNKPKDLPPKISEILASNPKNQLIKKFGIRLKDGEDSLHAIMKYWANHAITEITDVSAISYYQTTRNRPDPNDMEIASALYKLGRQGFENFLRTAFEVSKNQKKAFDKKLIYYLPNGFEQNDLTAVQFVNICINLQREYGVAFPFSDITFLASKNDSVKGSDLDKVIEFLAKNPLISFFELRLTCDANYTLGAFVQKLKDAKITTTIQAPNMWANERAPIDECILSNRQQVSKDAIGKLPVKTQNFAPVNMPKAWQQPRPKTEQAKLKIQYERSVEQTLETNVTTDSFTAVAAQRMQQIFKQQQRRQELHNQSLTTTSDVKPKDLIHEGNYEEEMAKRLKTTVRTEKAVADKYIKNLWKCLAGDKTKVVNYIMGNAMQAILLSDSTFQGGLGPHIPEGFYIEQRDIGKILFYEKVEKVPVNKTPLTAPLFNPRVEFIVSPSYKFFGDGDEVSNQFKIFKDCDPDGNGNPKSDSTSVLNSLLFLSKKLDVNITKDIEDNYLYILERFSILNFKAMRAIFFDQGPLGLKRFLSKLHQLQQKGLFDAFKTAFIDTSVNLIDLASEESYAAMDTLCGFNQNEAAWWIHLTTDQARLTKTTEHFVKTVEAFRYFFDEVYELTAIQNDPSAAKIRLELPNPCRITDSRSTYSTLTKVLIILKNAADVKEQLYNLDNVSLDQEAAYYAITQDGFNFVCSEMELTNDKPSPGEKFTYKVSLDLLADVKDQNFKRNFFRYLGTQQYLHPFAVYRKIYQQVTTSKLSEAQQKRLLVALAVSTTEQRSFYHNPQPHITEIINTLTALNNEDKKDAAEAALRVLNHLCLTLKESNLKPDIFEIKAIIQLLTRTENVQMLSKELHKFDHSDKIDKILQIVKGEHIENELDKLENFVKACGINSIKALALLGQQKKPLMLKKFIEFSNQLAEKLTKQEMPAAVIQQIIPCLAVLDLANPDADEIAKSVVVLNKEFPASLESLLKVLPKINVAASEKLLSQKFLEEINQTLNENDLRRLIASQYPGVSFTVPSRDAVDQDCKQELIAFIKEMSEKHAGLIKLMNLNPDEIIEKLRQSESKITVETIIEKLNVIESKHAVLAGLIGKNLLPSFIYKFCNVQQKHLHYLASNLSISEKLASDLNQTIMGYVRAVNDIESLKAFLLRRNIIFDLLKCINGIQPQTQRNDVVTALLDKWSKIDSSNKQEQFDAHQENFIKTVTDLLKDKNFSSGQKVALLKHTIMSNGESNLLLNDSFKRLAGMPALFDNVLTIINKFVEKSEAKWAIVNNAASIRDKFILDKNTESYTQDYVWLLSTLITLSENLQKKREDASEFITFIQKILSQQNNQEIQAILGQANEAAKISSLAVILTGLLPDLLKIGKTLAEIKPLINQLDRWDTAKLQAFAKLYRHKPYPDIDATIKAIREDWTAEQLAAPENYARFKGRNLDQQLTVDKNDEERIEQIFDLTNKQRLGEAKTESEDLKIKLKKIEWLIKGGEEKPGIAVSSNDKLVDKIKKLKNKLTAEQQNFLQLQSVIEEQKRAPIANKEALIANEKKLKQIAAIVSSLRVELLAYLCESYYRTTGKFPKTTQIVSVLLAIETGGNVITGHDPGQGKSLMDALKRAMLWGEGHTVDVTTSDLFLAKRDYKDSKDFYDFIGAESRLITRETKDVKAYQAGAIHFSDPSTLALYRAECFMQGFDHGEIQTPISLAADEIDKLLYDETGHYILSNASSSAADFAENRDSWIYPLVNEFMNLLDGLLSPEKVEQFKATYLKEVNPPYTIAQEVTALRNFLWDRVTEEQSYQIEQQRQRLSEQDFHLQLETWIESAKPARAKAAEEGHEYMVKEREKQPGANENAPRSYAAILEGGIPNTVGMWSYGVHQLVHAHLDTAQKQQGEKPTFECKPERKPIAIMDKHSFLSFYVKKGRILGGTATPGSELERIEAEEQYNFRVFKMPTHETNLRKLLPPVYANNEAEFGKALCKFIKKSGDQPILVLCKDIKAANDLKQQLKSFRDEDKIKLLTADKIDQKDDILKKAGEANAITISTFARRGTDIETNHPKGLLVIDTDLTTERRYVQGAGRSARNGQPGQAVELYNLKSLEKTFNIKLKKRKTKELNNIIAAIRKGLDTNSQQEREYNNRFITVLEVINKHLNLCHKKLLKAADENVKKDFAKIQQRLIDSIAKTWQDLNALPQDLQHDEANPIYPLQKLNYITDQFIKEANSLCRDSFITLSELANNAADKKTIASFVLRDELTRETTKSIDYQTNEYEQGNLFVRAFELGLEEPERLPNFMLRLSDTKSPASRLNNILSYRQQEKSKIVEVGRQLARTRITKYLSGFNIGNDRKKDAGILFDKLANANLQIPAIIASINQGYLKSLQSDLSLSKDSYFFSRAGKSRYRDMLFKVKDQLFAMCAPSQFKKIISAELQHVKDYLIQEIDRDVYKKKNMTEIHGFIQAILNTLEQIPVVKDPSFNNKLGEVLFYFDKIFAHFAAHPEHENQCALQNMGLGLQRLLAQAKVVLPNGAASYQAYHTLRLLLAELPPVPEPKRTLFTLFPSKKEPYSIPVNNMFKPLLDEAADLDPRQKYQLHRVCQAIRNHLASEYGAYDIAFELTKNRLMVNYNLLKAKTFETLPQSLEVELDWQKQNYFVKYQSAAVPALQAESVHRLE